MSDDSGTQESGLHDDSAGTGVDTSGRQASAGNSGESGSVSGVLELPTDALAANMGKLDVDDVSVENIEMLLSRIVGRIASS